MVCPPGSRSRYVCAATATSNWTRETPFSISCTSACVYNVAGIKSFFPLSRTRESSVCVTNVAPLCGLRPLPVIRWMFKALSGHSWMVARRCVLVACWSCAGHSSRSDVRAAKQRLKLQLSVSIIRTRIEGPTSCLLHLFCQSWKLRQSARQIVIWVLTETHEQPTPHCNAATNSNTATTTTINKCTVRRNSNNTCHSHNSNTQHTTHTFFTTHRTHDTQEHVVAFVCASDLHCGSLLSVLAFCCLFSGVSVVVCCLIATASCSLLLCASATRCSLLVLIAAAFFRCCSPLPCALVSSFVVAAT